MNRDSGHPLGRVVDPTADQIVIRAREASKRFNEAEAVDRISFAVPRGVIFGLIGPSGAGKTTLIRMLNGVYQPDAGELSVLDKQPVRFNGRQRMAIGYMPQLFALYPRLTVTENMHFVASMYGMGASRYRRIRETLEFVELWGHRRKQARALSGGMRRRLSLAAALIHEPELIFLDEPTASVDPVLRRKLWSGFFQLREEGSTLFVTTQYVSEAVHCDQVALLSGGRIVAMDKPDGLRRSAFGGEILMVEIDAPLQPVEQRELQRQPFVRSEITTHGGTRLRLVVGDAKSDIPSLMSWFSSRGIRVGAIDLHNPPFDDVFFELVKKAEAANGV